MFNFFDWIIEYLLNTIPGLLVDFFMWILEMCGVIVLKIINVLLEYILPLFSKEDFNIEELWQGLESSWGDLPYEALQVLTYIKIPEAISIVTTFLFINFIKNKIPFLK